MQRGRLGLKSLCRLCAGTLLLACFPLRAAEEIPRIRATLNQEQIAVDEEVTLTVEVSWAGEALDLQFDLPAPPEVHLLEMVSSAQSSVAYRLRGTLQHVRSFIFRLRGLEKGKGKVGEVQVAYQRPGEEERYTLESQPLNISITSAGKRFFRSAARVLLFLLLAAAGAALAGFYITWMIRRSRRRARELISEYVHSLEEESLEELKGASRLMVEGDREGFCGLLWRVLSGYLEKRFACKISDKRWDQVVEDPGLKILSEETRSQLAEILKMLERVRFGSYPRQEGELDVLLKKVRNFIESQTEK